MTTGGMTSEAPSAAIPWILPLGHSFVWGLGFNIPHPHRWLPIVLARFPPVVPLESFSLFCEAGCLWVTWYGFPWPWPQVSALPCAMGPQSEPTVRRRARHSEPPDSSSCQVGIYSRTEGGPWSHLATKWSAGLPKEERHTRVQCPSPLHSEAPRPLFVHSSGVSRHEDWLTSPG